MTTKRKILQNNERKDNDHLKYRGIKQNSYILNSAVFFLVRKFYILRRHFGALYVDMRCFGVSWLFSKHKIPHPNQWGSIMTTKNTSVTECFADDVISTVSTANTINSYNRCYISIIRFSK